MLVAIVVVLLCSHASATLKNYHDSKFKCFPLEVNHTITLVTISSESWLTIAIKVSRGIYASCILVAIMAAVATFIDIWVRK